MKNPIAALLRSASFTFVAVALMATANPAMALGTPATTEIKNTASVDYLEGGVGPIVTVTSNEVTLVVDEVLDVTVVANNATNVQVTSPDSDVPLSFTVTNTGNGTEPYELTINPAVVTNDFDPENVRLYLDNDGNGSYDGTEPLYVFNVNDPILAANGSIVVFAVSDIPGTLNQGDIGEVKLTALAVTATSGDTPGTTYPGLGDAGVDAVVGQTSAVDSDTRGYVVNAMTVTLDKAQAVDTGTTVIQGSEITYTLVLTVSGTGTATAPKITDNIPANTTYKPNTMFLNGSVTPLTDGAGDDEGEFTGTAVEVTLPDITVAGGAPVVNTLTFVVIVN